MPFSRQAASEPAATRSLNATTCARMKPRSMSEWIVPAASCARRAALDRPRAALVLARRQEGDEPEQLVGRADHAVEARLGEPQVLAEGLRVLRRQLGHLGLDRGRDRADSEPGLARVLLEARALEPRGRLADLLLTEVGDEQHRLAGQERVAAQPRLLVLRELELAQRPLGFERLLQPLEERALAHVLGLVGLLDVGLEPLEPALDRGEVGEDQLELEHLRVAQGVERAVGVRRALGLEGAHHVDERVHAPQRGQVDERLALALGDAGHVHVLDGRERLLLRVEQLG